MAPFSFFVSIAFLLSTLPNSLAGPACAKKHYKAADCLQKCKSRWGWNGFMMGNDPWGSVVKKTDATIDWDSVISQACGSAVTSSAAPTSTASQTETVRAPALQGTPSSSANRLSASVVSYTVTSVASSTSSSASVQNFDASIRPSSTRAPPLSTTTPQTRISTTRIVVQPSPTGSPSSPPTQGSGASPSADIQVYLQAHNSVRSRHGAADLTWSNDLAAKAQEWANGCQFKHSGGSLGPFGENLAAGTGSYSFQSGMDAWAGEISEYNPNNPVPSHFTQVVWKGTSQVGCAVSTCSGIFDAKFGPAQYYVCEYSAQGNIIGRFAQNVQV